MRPPRPSDVVVLPFIPDEEEDPTLPISALDIRPVLKRERTPTFDAITKLSSWWGHPERRLPPSDPEETSSMRAPRPVCRLPRPPPLPKPQLVVHYEPPSPWMLPLLVVAGLFLSGIAFFIAFTY